MKLPAGPGVPASDGQRIVAEAVAACRGVTSITAEMSVSGSVGGQRLRGHMLVGVQQPGSVRLEAAAPFGAPLFIFVARGDDSTLLLPRDNRVLEHGKSVDVLEATAGVPLGPGDLDAMLTGCAPAPDSSRGTEPSVDWRIVPDAAGEIYLHRERASAPWRIVAVVRPRDRGGWRAEYADFQNGLPTSVRLTSLQPKRFDLRLALSQVETNVALGAEAFQVQIPRGTRPITLDELREAGPLRSSR
jgi:outer membrane lipoprotein-sorting protein